MRRFLPGLALLALLLACDKDDSPTGPPGPPATLDEAMRLWQSFGIQDYQVDQHHGCYCPPPRDWTATVRNGQVQGMGMSIDQLFAEMQRAQHDADHFEATYDATYGYPTQFYIDWSVGMADDESDWTLSNFSRLVR
jgi:hypothetical protein